MNYEWDHAKAVSNLQKHGVSFDTATSFDWTLARERPDTRQDYGEARWIAYAPIGDRLHVMIYTLRAGDAIRLISLRKANSREVSDYEATFD